MLDADYTEKNAQTARGFDQKVCEAEESYEIPPATCQKVLPLLIKSRS